MSAIIQGGIQYLPRNHLAGLKVANNATDAPNDIDIAVGECRSDDNTDDIYLTTPLTKRLDAVWAAGTNQGCRDTGAISDATWHYYLIKNPTTGAVDVVATVTYGSPTMPSGFTLKRRILSIRRSVSLWGGLSLFLQDGNYFQAKPPIQEATSAINNAGTTGPITLTFPPVGFRIFVHMSIQIWSTVGASHVVVSDLSSQDLNGTMITAAANQYGIANMFVWTNASAQIRYTGYGAGVNNYKTSTLGFIDHRGKED